MGWGWGWGGGSDLEQELVVGAEELPNEKEIAEINFFFSASLNERGGEGDVGEEIGLVGEG